MPIIVVIILPTILDAYMTAKHIMTDTRKGPAFILCRSSLSPGTILTRTINNGIPARYMGTEENRRATSGFISHSGLSTPTIMAGISCTA